MARPLTARQALARAMVACLVGNHEWSSFTANARRSWLDDAAREMRALRKLGFEIAPVKRVRVKRRASK